MGDPRALQVLSVFMFCYYWMCTRCVQEVQMCTGCAHDNLQMRNGCVEDVSGYYWMCTRCVQEVQMCTGFAHDNVHMRNGCVEDVY